MEEISNKSLAILLVVAIVVSMGGTFITLKRTQELPQVFTPTGAATTSSEIGTTNVTIQENAEVTFTVSNINFGAGYVNASFTNCNMTSNTKDGAKHYQGCVGFTEGATTADGELNTSLVLENTGNRNLSINLNASVDADSFIGGGASGNPSPLFQWKLKPASDDPNRAGDGDDTVASCNNAWKDTSAYTNVNTTSIGTCVCGDCSTTHYFDPANDRDEVFIDFYVRIPADAVKSAGSTATIYALGTY